MIHALILLVALMPAQEPKIAKGLKPGQVYTLTDTSVGTFYGFTYSVLRQRMIAQDETGLMEMFEEGHAFALPKGTRLRIVYHSSIDDDTTCRVEGPASSPVYKEEIHTFGMTFLAIAKRVQ